MDKRTVENLYNLILEIKWTKLLIHTQYGWISKHYARWKARHKNCTKVITFIYNSRRGKTSDRKQVKVFETTVSIGLTAKGHNEWIFHGWLKKFMIVVLVT